MGRGAGGNVSRRGEFFARRIDARAVARGGVVSSAAMTPDTVKIIQLLVAPVVMISACGLLGLALYNRLHAIVTRARAFHKERFDVETKLVAEGGIPDPTVREHYRRRFESLEVQAEHVLRRAKLVRGALLAYLTVVLCMLASSLSLGLSLLAPAFAKVALALFLAGVVSAAAATLLSMKELLHALDPIALEYTAFEDARE